MKTIGEPLFWSRPARSITPHGSIRPTALGWLFLGVGFLWSDLVCCLIGIAIDAVAEAAIVAKMMAFTES